MSNADKITTESIEQSIILPLAAEELLQKGQSIRFTAAGNSMHPTIKKGDTLSFASNIPHYFENPSKKIKARCIIVQNPKSY